MLELNSCYKTTRERDDVLLWYRSLRKSNPLQGGDMIGARKSAGSFNYKDRSGESDMTRICPPQGDRQERYAVDIEAVQKYQSCGHRVMLQAIPPACRLLARSYVHASVFPLQHPLPPRNHLPIHPHFYPPLYLLTYALTLSPTDLYSNKKSGEI
jgi:hypothetical protein